MEIAINSLPLPVKKDVNPQNSSAVRRKSEPNSSFRQYIAQISTDKGVAKVTDKKSETAEAFLAEDQEDLVPASLLWQLLWQITLQNKNTDAILKANGSGDWQKLIEGQSGLNPNKIDLSSTNPLPQETLDKLLGQIRELGLTEAANTVLTNMVTEEITNLIDTQQLETSTSSENEPFLIKDETGHLKAEQLNLATNNTDKLLDGLKAENNLSILEELISKPLVEKATLVETKPLFGQIAPETLVNAREKLLSLGQINAAISAYRLGKPNLLNSEPNALALDEIVALGTEKIALAGINLTEPENMEFLPVNNSEINLSANKLSLEVDNAMVELRNKHNQVNVRETSDDEKLVLEQEEDVNFHNLLNQSSWQDKINKQSDSKLELYQPEKLFEPKEIPDIVVQRINLNNLGNEELKLKLYPKELGEVRIAINFKQGQLNAEFKTENPLSQKLIEQQMPLLKKALESQGLQLGEFSLGTGTFNQQGNHYTQLEIASEFSYLMNGNADSKDNLLREETETVITSAKPKDSLVDYKA